MKTNLGLVSFALVALAEKWGYVWGTFGQLLTKELFEQKLAQYPEEVGKFQAFIAKNWLGKKTVDCVGLIKAYLWTQNGKIKYDSSMDVSANGMYEKAKVKGPIDTMPEVVGLCVWMKGHIGIYIGGGWVIEARGTKIGVVKTRLRGTGANSWTHWLECPFIQYVKEQPKVEQPAVVFTKGEEALEKETAKVIDALNAKIAPVSIDRAYWMDVILGRKVVTKENVFALLKKLSSVIK